MTDTTTKAEPRYHPQLEHDFKRGLGHAAYVIDKMRSTDWLFLQEEGYAQATQLLDEAEDALRMARDARCRMAELDEARRQEGEAA